MHKHHRALGLAFTPSGSRGAADVAKSRPVHPVTLLRPHAARRAARFFTEKFPGRSLYAVKANPSPDLLQILWDTGVTHYDVASIGEVRLVHETLPEAVLCFMHPVKAEEAIAEAYFGHGVKTFSLDSFEELDKIVRATSTDDIPATDLNLLVRIRVSSDHAELSLASKFGAARRHQRAADGRPRGRRRARNLFSRRQPSDDSGGVCRGDDPVRAAIVEAAITVDIVDVGGGFPSSYPGMEPPPLETYFSVIHQAFESLPISYSAELWCEPGRALCAEYASVLVRVEKRRGDELYINDGAYGALFDAAHISWRYPVKLIREKINRTRVQWSSASTDPLATISTAWPAPSSSPPTSAPATISRSACSAPTAAQCAPISTASASSICNRRRRADGEPLRHERTGAFERCETVEVLPFRHGGRGAKR